MDRATTHVPARVPAGRLPWAAQALALAAVFAAELALFSAATSRHYAWAFPRWYDQAQYLNDAYGAYDWMRAHGFAAGLKHALAHVSAQGSLHGFAALLVFTALGPSRMAALSVNLLAFLALQGATFVAVRRLSGGYALAWAAVGLLAALGGPWSGGAGSAIDYRLDWMAACAYGVALAAAVASDGFRSTRWSALFGAAVGVALLARFLTAVYFALIYLALLSWLLSRPGRRDRAGRLVLSALGAACAAGWAFWRGRREIYDYYWVGHFASVEGALRDAHLTAAESLRWICTEVLLGQVGWPALALGLAAAALLLLPAGQAAPPPPRGMAAEAAYPVALAFLAAPALVLALHPSKAEQTVSILIPGVVWAVILLWIRLSRGAGRLALRAASAVALLGGALVFARGQARSTWTRQMEDESRKVNALGDYVYFRAQENGLSQPRIAVTWVSGSLSADVMRIIGRERHTTPIDFIATLPPGILATTPEAVRKALTESDFVFLVTRAAPSWPFDGQMEAMRPELRTWCDGHLRRVGELDTGELSASIYERPALAGPAGARRASLASLLESASLGPADAPALPPYAPLFLGPASLLWSTRSELRFAVRTAYGPVKVRPVALPEGFAFVPGSGEMRGRFTRAGVYTATLEAENARGVSATTVSLRVVDDPWGGDVTAPAAAKAGVPVELAYSAFDPGCDLDFIDITDLTAVKVLDRLVAGENEHEFWQGRYRLTFRAPGRHLVVLRIVRYDPADRVPYGFVDRSFTVDVAP